MEIIINKKHIKLAVSRIQDINFYESKLDYKYISKAKTSFKNEKRILEWLNTHYLIYKLTSQSLTYYYNNHGAPVFENSDLHLSIAHSDNFSALLLSDKYNVGIDIEEKNRDFTIAAQRFMHEDEKKWAKTNDDFLKIWCFKEAVYKILQNSSPNFSKEYNCLILGKNKASVKIHNRFFILEYMENKNYFVTWCYDKL